ncbi:MAG: TolC family protein [Candidatus Omnitrophica bacterium]|nr:TolC family protein [Candidatus Omnitrophota bacterium]
MRKTILLTTALCLVSWGASAAETTMTWEDCVRTASRNNPDLVAAGETVVQSRAAKALAGTNVYPQLSANAAAGESQSKKNGQKATHSDSYSYGVSGSLLLFDGLSASNAMRSAAQNLAAASEAYRFSSADIRLQLRTAFINMLKAQSLIRVAQDIVHIRGDELKLISLRYKSGLEHKGAWLDTKVSMTQAVIDLKQAVRGLKLARRQLNQAMGQKDDYNFRVSAGFDVKEAFSSQPDFAVIANNHPSVKQAKAKERSADFSLKAVRGSYYPQVSLQGSATKDGAQWPPEDRGLGAQVVVSLPLLEGGSRQAKVAQAESILRQSTAQLSSVQNSVQLGLAQAWEDFRQAVEAVRVAREALKANEERSLIAEAQYSTGFISYDNLTIIQNNLVQSKKSWLNARANALLTEARWVSAKGETLEYANQ